MPASNADTIAYLRSLPSIRERCGRVFALAEAGKLDYWTVDLAQQDKIVEFVCGLIARDFGTDYASIPPHGRWRHFVGGRVDPLLSAWDDAAVDPLEKARRLVDLMVTSVLLDAGAGNDWKFQPKDGGDKIGRSEGLAVGSLEMFEQGMFSGDAAQPCRVDGALCFSALFLYAMAARLTLARSTQRWGCRRSRQRRSPRRCKSPTRTR
mgnify:CR=1 FL=1